MKILITGAHFTTAVAVIEELKKYKDIEITYVGRRNTLEGDRSKSVESTILPELGVKFIPIITGRLQRSFTINTIPSLLKIPIGFVQSFYILMKEKPDVILSFGGYVAAPLVVIGWLLSIPIIIHEQTLVTGLANRISSWFASKIAVSFDVKNDFDPRKVILTGNPMRREILSVIPAPAKGWSASGGKAGIQKTEKTWIPDQVGDDNDHNVEKLFKSAKKEKMPVIFITGGNQGSHTINLAIEDCLDEMTKIAFVIHQTGDSKFKDFERLKQKEGDRYLVGKWFDNVAEILKRSDLVIGRSGINTLTELAYLGVPALVIPIPYLYQDEQTKNARYFENLGFVKILPQAKLSGKNLLDNIKDCLADVVDLKSRAKKAKNILIPDAAKRVALETSLLGRNP